MPLRYASEIIECRAVATTDEGDDPHTVIRYAPVKAGARQHMFRLSVGETAALYRALREIMLDHERT